MRRDSRGKRIFGIAGMIACSRESGAQHIYFPAGTPAC